MKEKLTELLKEPFHSLQLSQLKKGVELPYTKVTVKPFVTKDTVLYQLTYTYPKKVTHENMDFDSMTEAVCKLLSKSFIQCQIYGKSYDYHLTYFNSLKIHRQNATKTVLPKQHNRQKEYIITEDEGADFLRELGVVNKNGTISQDKYDKFRQINRYLEFVTDFKDKFPKDRAIKIVDFGCGKSYLTFALYYYLTKKLGLNAVIRGLDLKEDVVEHCSQLALRLNYSGLSFSCGDIKDYISDSPPDMVISLHACDTATDEALFKGICWNSKIILAVPCCHHELNPQLKSAANQGLLDYGILRERLACIITDAARALLMEAYGYKTDIAEFISLEHTPKNLLIRCVKGNSNSKKAQEKYNALKNQWSFTHTLETRLKENGLF